MPCRPQKRAVNALWLLAVGRPAETGRRRRLRPPRDAATRRSLSSGGRQHSNGNGRPKTEPGSCWRSHPPPKTCSRTAIPRSCTGPGRLAAPRGASSPEARAGSAPWQPWSYRARSSSGSGGENLAVQGGGTGAPDPGNGRRPGRRRTLRPALPRCRTAAAQGHPASRFWEILSAACCIKNYKKWLFDNLRPGRPTDAAAGRKKIRRFVIILDTHC